MTKMNNYFVEKDSNNSNNWLSAIQPTDNLMRMGDGTEMEQAAFSDTIPIMSYTPEELGINMNASPEATAIAATNPYPYTDRQEVMVDNSPSPALNVVKEDFIDGGVQFAAEGNSVIGAVFDEVKDFAKSNPLLMFGLGAFCLYGFQVFRSNP